MKYLIYFILAVSVRVRADIARFDNYKVYRLIPITDDHVAKLAELEESDSGFDFWKSSTTKDVPVDIMVPPHKEAQFRDLLETLKINSEIYIEDVQTLVDKSTRKVKTTKDFSWTDYHRGDEINAWLDLLIQEYPDKVTVVIGGRSYEGRDIKGVKVSFKHGNKGVFLEAGIHAREWISTAVTTYILNELLTSQDKAVRDIAESYDWYVFPSVNPDGYEFTHTKDRLWRKTRQPQGLMCHGVDANRNWGFHWMDGGASSYPCADIYAGTKAFSEPETKSLSEYISSIHDKLIAHIGIHSYSQYLLIPFGYTNEPVDNYDELFDIGKKAAASLAQRYGTKYTVGNTVEVIYKASGSSMDWVKGTFNIPIVYNYELRDTGKYGFLLPPEQIIPTGEETLDSLITMMKEARARGHK